MRATDDRPRFGRRAIAMVALAATLTGTLVTGSAAHATGGTGGTGGTAGSGDQRRLQSAVDDLHGMGMPAR